MEENSRDMSLDAIKRRAWAGQSDHLDVLVLLDALSRRLTVEEWQAVRREAEADRVLGVRMVCQTL